MVAQSFDPTHAVRFDLPHGSVRTRGDDDRVVLVPAGALVELLRAAPAEAAEALARALGSAIGRRAAARLGDPEHASVEAFVAQLAGEAAIAGVGALGVERWGRALVVAVEGSPFGAPLVALLLSAALESASGRRTWCAPLGQDGPLLRVLVGSERTVERARALVASGVAWGEALVRLHGGAA